MLPLKVVIKQSTLDKGTLGDVSFEDKWDVIWRIKIRAFNGSESIR
jgi:hypothetical protein